MPPSRVGEILKPPNWDDGADLQVPISHVHLNRSVSAKDDPNNIPNATCAQWCEHISTPSQQVRAEDLKQIFDYSFMKKSSDVSTCSSFRQELELLANVNKISIYVNAFWMLADQMEEKDLVGIIREGSALLQDPVRDRVASLKQIDKYFQDVRKQHRKRKMEQLRRSLQLEEDLRSI